MEHRAGDHGATEVVSCKELTTEGTEGAEAIELCSFVT